MLPAAIRARLKNPGALQKEFVTYLEKAGAKITITKNIASVSYYDTKTIGANKRLEFFKGDPVTGSTNISTGSFIRPESEHALIYAIRAFTGTNALITDANYSAGGQNAFAHYTNSFFSVVNNGVTVLKDYYTAEGLTGLFTKDQGLIDLDEPVLWLGQTECPIDWTTFTTTTLATTHLRFEYLGIGLIS